MKKLIVSGCSFTDRKFKSQFYPEMDCSWPKWPELLAKKLNMECVNLGKSGAGNEYIFRSLVNTIMGMDHAEIGLVIPAWSGIGRIDYQMQDRWMHTVEIDPNNVRINMFNEWHFTTGDPTYYSNKSLGHCFNLQTTCELYNIPLKQFQMLGKHNTYLRAETIWRQQHALVAPGKIDSTKNIDILRKKLISSFLKNPLFEHINEDHFIGWPIFSALGGYIVSEEAIPIKDGFRLSEKDHHPNAKGHEKLAEFVYENI